MRAVLAPWRDRAPKVDETSRCCWVCGRLGGEGFTLALRHAGYRMAPGQMGYAHAACMMRANREHVLHMKENP